MLALSRLLSRCTARTTHSPPRCFSLILFNSITSGILAKSLKSNEKNKARKSRGFDDIPLNDRYKNETGFKDGPKMLIQDENEAEQKNSNFITDYTEFTKTKFADISNIPPYIKEALVKQYPFEYATKIQEEIFNLMPIKKDIKAQASTGSGKTLAYLIPCIEIMQRCLSPENTSKGKQVSVLILAPTRELVLQISSEAKKLLRRQPYNVLPFIGGTSQKEDLNRIITKRVDVVVATPGRVVDLILSSRVFRSQLEELKVLVLDEADELMKQGFAQNILTVLKNLPRTHQTMMFSATMPIELENLVAKKAFRQIDNVIKINTCMTPLEQQSALQYDKIEQKVAYVSHNLHLHLLYGIIRQNKKSKMMLFLPTVLHVQIFAGLFKTLGFEVLEMHSLLEQKERVQVANEFRFSQSGLLVTTDVSARGMDYPNVDLVLQWGVPSSIDGYLHRIGRTGRAGQSGKAILIVTPLEDRFLRSLDERGIPFENLNVETDVTKPPSKEIHNLNLLCLKIKPGLIRQLFRTSLAHYLSQCRLLGTTRKQAHAQAKNFIKGLDHQPPSLDWKHLSAETKLALAQVDQAKSLINDLKF